MSTKQYYHNIDLVKVGQLVNARFQNVTNSEMAQLASELTDQNKGLTVYNTDLSIQLIWDGTQFKSEAGSAGEVQVELITLTEDDVQAKQILLAEVPTNPGKTLIQLQTGIAQYVNTDFVVEDQFVKWNGLALELLVEAGQKLHVTYQ